MGQAGRTAVQAYSQFLFRSTPAVVFRRHLSPPSTAFRPWMFSMGMICMQRTRHWPSRERRRNKVRLQRSTRKCVLRVQHSAAHSLSGAPLP